MRTFPWFRRPRAGFRLWSTTDAPFWLAPLGLLLAIGLLQAPGRPNARAASTSAAVAFGPGKEMVIYAGGLQNGWQDWGWAHRSVGSGQPARLNMTKYAGWILGNRNLVGNWTELHFKIKAPAAYGSFLEVRLGAEGAPDDAFARLPVPTSAAPDASGYVPVHYAMQQLNPQGLDFDRIIFRAHTNVGTEDVFVDGVGLVAGQPVDTSHGKEHVSKAIRPVTLAVRCNAPTHAISEGIYGIAFSPRKVGKEDAPFLLNASVRRWGGNPATRYNWKLGNAWNTASDWFFKNVNYTNKEDYSWRDFLAENEAHNLKAAITVPTLGWVAKDTTSYAFSEASLGKQKYAQNDAGNGIRPDGSKLPSPAPELTSVAAPPAFGAAWVTELEKYQAQGHAGSIFQYILDNEPALWNSTHRDVHPQALTYDELLTRTVAYGEAIRKAAPKADIAGPAEWGWPAYFFSARDQEVGFRLKPDRRAHGDVPLLAWYLRALRARAEKTGSHVLDTVDLHFYPQISGVYGHGEQTTPQGAAKRLRATRSLWDPSYKDESWIADTIELLPRMQKLIAENYPGRKISLGEYNFGGEQHISGALALAESLGRFAQFGVHSAYLWTYPPDKSPAQQAFLAFRNYDGEGGRFLDSYVQSTMNDDVSLFVSQDSASGKLVAIAINKNPDVDFDAHVQLEGCGNFSAVKRFGLTAENTQLHAEKEVFALSPAAPPTPAQSAKSPGHGVKKDTHATVKHVPASKEAQNLAARLTGYSVTIFELSR